MKRSNKITKHLSKLQDKLENGKLSPKQIKSLRPGLIGWIGAAEAMLGAIDGPPKPGPPKSSSAGVAPGTHG